MISTALRFRQMRAHIDPRVVLGFGLMNAGGALAGALGLTGFTEKLRLGRTAPWTAGAVSGAFGGLVGNQGGIQAAAMLGLGVRKEAFVATAAIALCVDAVRIPVYFESPPPRAWSSAGSPSWSLCGATWSAFSAKPSRRFSSPSASRCWSEGVC